MLGGILCASQKSLQRWARCLWQPLSWHTLCWLLKINFIELQLKLNSLILSIQFDVVRYIYACTLLCVARCIITLKSFPKPFAVHFSSPSILISSDHWFVFSYSFSNSRISHKYIIQSELFSLKEHFWDSSRLFFTSICSFFIAK